MSSSLFSAESTRYDDDALDDLIRGSLIRRLNLLYETANALYPAFLADAGIRSEADFVAAYSLNGRPFPALAEFDLDMFTLVTARLVRNQQPLVVGPRALQ